MTVRIIPLGGVGEIGKNLTVIESEDAIVVIDAGIAFPRDEMPGIDLVLPDLAYLRARREKLRAVILTHGHEDHVGGLPYLLREVGAPEVWGTRLTLGLVRPKLEEHHLVGSTTLREIDPHGPPVAIGPFRADFARVTHSIPDAVAVALHTDDGTIMHTGDYKIDHTPIDGRRTDMTKLASIGTEGVALMLGDSTNAERPGVTISESRVAEALVRIVHDAPGRVIVTSFASHIHRLAELIRAAEASDRRVCVVGRSMVRNVGIARSLGYLDVPDGLIVKPAALGDLAPEQVLILCTGSQGEPLSALTRIAFGDHRQVQIRPGDTVILAAKPVPGNELAVHDTINQLWNSGAVVLHQEIADVHASGHGSAEELKTMLALVRPSYLAPVHGEARHQHAHARLANTLGIADDHVFITRIGDCLELNHGTVRRGARVESGISLVDGLGIGDIGDVVLRDRKQLSADGTIVIVCQLHDEDGHPAEPEVITRGFAFEGAERAETLLDEVYECAADTIDAMPEREIKLLQTHIHDAVAELIYTRSRKRPLVIPVIIDV